MLHQMCLVYSPRLVQTLNSHLYKYKYKYLFKKGAIIDFNFFVMFTAPERKDKIEDQNRILVQQFQSQLTKQLDTLHKTIAASVTQQEQQLKGMEEDMQSFVSTKAQVISLAR